MAHQKSKEARHVKRRLRLYISRPAIISPFSMEFMIRHEGRELGPYSEPEVRSRLIAGTISLSDLGLAEGTHEWTPLSTFAQFATSYREPPPIPPSPGESEASPTRQPLEAPAL